MKPEMWTMIGVGIGLTGLGTGGFTLLCRYIAAPEKLAEERSASIDRRADERSAGADKRAEERSATAEKRAEERSTAIEKRAEERSASIENRAEARSTDIEKRPDARLADLKADLKADLHMLAERVERNHADLRHAIDNLILTDQAKRLTILEGGGAPHGAAVRRLRGAALITRFASCQRQMARSSRRAASTARSD